MLDDEVLYRRLSFIKYVFQDSVTRSQSPEPMCYSAVLGFHDAVELFLQLSAEHLGTKSGTIPFMEYWDLINKTLSQGALSHQETMRRLNKARVSLKHHGTFPSKLDLDSFRLGCHSFFKESAQLVLGLDFGTVSLADLVPYPKTKSKLQASRGQLEHGQLKESIESSALAFQTLLEEYEETKRSKFGSIFTIGSDFTFQNSFFMNIEDRDMARFIDSVKQSFEDVNQKLKIIGFGIDYRAYAHFDHIAPYVYSTLDGKSHTNHKRESYTESDAQFCLDFCIESSLVLARYDFEIVGEE